MQTALLFIKFLPAIVGSEGTFQTDFEHQSHGQLCLAAQTTELLLGAMEDALHHPPGLQSLVQELKERAGFCQG